ncbi:MAG TPA: hypothetical protein PK965_08570 [Anaerohalosphaeraceae bacterium]|nr:hypothetical protein [Anaerohalosphaeraceae bacterium]
MKKKKTKPQNPSAGGILQFWIAPTEQTTEDEYPLTDNDLDRWPGPIALPSPILEKLECFGGPAGVVQFLDKLVIHRAAKELTGNESATPLVLALAVQETIGMPYKDFERLPKIEQLRVLQEAVQHKRRVNTVPQEQQPLRLPKEPRKEAREAYLLYCSGYNQSEIAEMLSKEYERPFKQYTVSRLIKEYKVWAKHHNLPTEEKGAKPKVAYNNRIVELGKRTDGRMGPK